MTNIHLPKFDHARNVVKNMKGKGQEWDEIVSNYDQLKMLGVINDEVIKEVWAEIVREQKNEYNKPETIEKRKIESSIVSKEEDNETTIPADERSSWQLYKNKLINNGFREEAVENIEKSAFSVLKKLNTDTSQSEPVKGLVIGQVQSGKTASMAGLMAMAADWGWNTFIVLSGMVENLREQTQSRLIDDLNNPGNNVWHSLQKLSRTSPPGQRLQDLNLEEGSSQRYLNVCLKNKTRLENLISWLKADKNKLEKLKILVIDDEADQASVNTKKLSEEERAKINELVIKLVEVDKESRHKPKSMNYISYTATPYSNFLNESTSESLYPRNFISMLPVSNEYFGPKQIFGYSDEYVGLDIVRNISEEDHEQIKSLHDRIETVIPRSLQESICWFMCATAAMRYHNFNKPISMLVHTSQRQAYHNEVANAISDWITQVENKNLLNMCESLYKRETEQFSLNRFREGYPNYPIHNNYINNYPEFTSIMSLILELKSEISHIKMDEEGDLDYHKGIHLCIDNSAKNGINNEDMHIRLAYPTKRKLKQLSNAPAFIIVGGSTLSRGLTIQGLVSTYFLRATTAADSLMQMGRWFGYRRGYELFPRIWMTDDTYEKFEFLTELEEELREELDEFAIDNKSPSEYGPRVRNTPKVSWIRITAKNKMQQAEEIDMDFTGTSIQTIHFQNNKEILEKNIKVTENFLLNSCGKPVKSLAQNSIVYQGVEFEKIQNEFLLKMNFNNRSRVFNQIESFCKWYQKVEDEIGFKKWNVIVAGSGEVECRDNTKGNKWYLEPFSVGKVNRSAKYSYMNYSKNIVNIGVLRGPGDMFADIKSKAFFENHSFSSISNKEIEQKRKEYNLENVPQLIIYRIDKNSKARTSSKNKENGRKDLNFDEDIIGVYINVPGDSSNKPHAKGLRVKIDATDNNE